MSGHDEGMVTHTGGVPYASYPPRVKYPPLPPAMNGELLVMQETLTRTALHHGGQVDETRQQVEALVSRLQMTVDQFDHVQRQHDKLATQTAECLRFQHD